VNERTNERREKREELCLSLLVEIHGTACRMKWCQTCGFYRPPRCSHCSVCDFCIDVKTLFSLFSSCSIIVIVVDIRSSLSLVEQLCRSDSFVRRSSLVDLLFFLLLGRRNYRYFLGFLLSVLFHMFSVLGSSLFYLIVHRSNLLDVRTLICLILMVLISLLSVPIGGLTIFHFLLIVRGRTTNEQVTGKFKSNTNPVRPSLSSRLISSDLISSFFSLMTVGLSIVVECWAHRRIRGHLFVTLRRLVRCDRSFLSSSD
jgi:palmitoyltransferase ZDHHC5/8